MSDPIDRAEILDHGHVELLDYCASDLAIVNAARVSLNQESEELSERDVGLIGFLMRERHGSPFEHGYFRFRIKAPIFVFREWHRHRVGHSYNEWSARYSQLEPEFYVPEKVLTQLGKPGRYYFEEMDDERPEIFQSALAEASQKAYDLYVDYLTIGVSKQQARLFLPVNTYSEMYWSCNPRSLMHFLSLRDSEQAQMEIREYAKAASLMFESVMPNTYQAFVQNGRKSP